MMLQLNPMLPIVRVTDKMEGFAFIICFITMYAHRSSMDNYNDT